MGEFGTTVVKVTLQLPLSSVVAVVEDKDTSDGGSIRLKITSLPDTGTEGSVVIFRFALISISRLIMPGGSPDESRISLSTNQFNILSTFVCDRPADASSESFAGTTNGSDEFRFNS